MNRDLNALARKVFALIINGEYLQLTPKEADISIKRKRPLHSLPVHCECCWTNGSDTIFGSLYITTTVVRVCISLCVFDGVHKSPYSWHEVAVDQHDVAIVDMAVTP